MDKIFLLITSGRGPVEVALATQQTVDALQVEAAQHGVECDISTRPAKGDGLLSATIVLSGTGARAFAQTWIGTVLCRFKSKQRTGHKRQNWYVGVFELQAPPASQAVNPTEVSFSTLRAGGPGGQHQNTTDSAVRAVWNGIQVVVRSERSQHRNKAEALRRLQQIIDVQQSADVMQRQGDVNKLHNQLQRGNPIRQIT